MLASPKTISRRLLACALLAAALVISACGDNPDDWSQPRARVAPIGTLGPGFVDRENPPAPEATVTPRPGSWDNVHPGKGYRVVLLTAGDAPETKTMIGAVRAWANSEQVSLKTLTAANPRQYIPRIVESLKLKPDLVIAVGNELVDPLALVTANHLDQNFLVIGAELPEPTYNVTAANWPGASFRGEGLQAATPYDPRTFTRERTTRALRAGVAAVLHGITGIVLRIDDGPSSAAPPRS